MRSFESSLHYPERVGWNKAKDCLRDCVGATGLGLGGSWRWALLWLGGAGNHEG